MVKQISSVDLHFMAQELQSLVGSRFDKVYNSGKEEIFLQSYKTGQGKKLLRIIIGKGLFIAEKKATDQTPSGFCLVLRKHIDGFFIDKLEQIDSERILKLSLAKKEEKKYVYIEFFGKGNIILVDEKNNIIDSSTKHRFKDRDILPKQPYSFPPMDINFKKLTTTDLATMLKKSDMDSVVKALAIGLGLGGVFAEELCALAEVEKKLEPKKVDERQAGKLVSKLKLLLKTNISPAIIFKDEKPKDVTPFDLAIYEKKTVVKHSTLQAAYEAYYDKAIEYSNRVQSPYEQKIRELKRIVDEQKQAIQDMEQKVLDQTEKGEKIYEKYQDIQTLVTDLDQIREKHSWKDIKEKLKGHKVIKEINEKKGTISISI